MKRFSVFAIIPVLMLSANAARAADAFAPGDAHDLVAQACTACHAAELVTSSGKTREGWADTVTTMVGNGAAVTDKDFDKVVDYLAKNYPVK